MHFERSFMNWDMGFGVCCWNAPSQEKLEELFKKANTPFTEMIPVEEHVEESLVT